MTLYKPSFGSCPRSVNETSNPEVLLNLLCLYPKKNIVDEYHNAWQVSSSINNEKLRSCEQELISLDEKELKDFLQKYQYIHRHLNFELPTFKTLFAFVNIYKKCTLLHLFHVFCIPGQSGNLKLVQNCLKDVLQNLSEEMRYKIFERYISQQQKVKFNLTNTDLLTGKIDPQHEFQLKLCYWNKLLLKNNKGGCKIFLQQNVDFLVSKIEEVVLLKKTNIKCIACKILLCLFNWNIWNQKTTILNTEIEASLSVTLRGDLPREYQYTVHKVRSILQTIVLTLTEEELITTFNDYLDQMYAMKSEITADGLCTGMIDPKYEFLLKLCYCEKLCNTNDKTYKEFLQRNADFLVPQIEAVVAGNKIKWKLISFKILLCLLKWGIRYQKTLQNPPVVHNAETQDSPLVTSVADTQKKYVYLCTENTLIGILQSLLPVLSADEIFTAFNEYLDHMHACKSKITEDDFCTGKIDPYHEFLLKLCYCEKLCNANDVQTYRKFLRKNAEFLEAQIEKLVHRKKTNTKTKLISCKVLLCLLKWGVCNQKTAYTSFTNILSEKLTKKVYRDFMNKNIQFFVSMVGTVMTRNSGQSLITLCDVLLYNKHHFLEVTGAVNKLIRYYATQVGINEKILEWICMLEYRYRLRYREHLKHKKCRKSIKKIDNSFQKTWNLVKDLFVDFGNEKKTSTYYFEKELDLTRLMNLWIEKFNGNQKTTLILNNIRKKDKEVVKGENVIPRKILNFFLIMKNVIKDRKAFLSKKTCHPFNETIKESFVMQLLLLLWMDMVGALDQDLESAKKKKYLTIKYEYAMATLNLLWCSGDIEVHPGPCPEKKSLVYDSTIERRWIQNIKVMIISRLPELLQSLYTTTKKVRNDRENREHFKTLLKKCLEEKVHVPKIYLDEINAWETKEYHLLYTLFVYRCGIETIITSLQDLFICGGSTKDLTDINVSLDTELKTNDITTILGKDHRPTDKSQLIVYITRHIAGIAIKCAHGKDPDAKCDGLWDLPLKNWPKDIILFDPNNRGKYSEEKTGKKLIPDQELVDMLLRLQQVTIPQKYKDIIEAFKAMRKSKTKQHKEQLCSTFKRSTSLEKINYALKNLCKNGILTEEIYDILTKWWKTGTVESRDDQTQSLQNMDDAKKIERPHILIYIHTKSITFTVEPTSPNSSQVSYNFPVKYELVPLKTMKLLPTPEENPGDNQTDSIIPQETMNILNSIITFDPNIQAMVESDIKLQCKTSTQDTASSSMTHLNQTTSSSFQFSQSNQNIAIYGQPGPILCTHNQLMTNSDDLGHLHLSATKDSKNLAFQNLVSPTSDMGSSNSISSVNSESGNEERDQNNTLNEGQDLTTDSDYSSDNSNNCVSKTSMKKRKCIEEDRIEMKKRKIPSLKQDKKLVSPTSDMGSSSSISSVNSESGNEERDQNNTLIEGQDQSTDSDYSSDSSNNCVSKTSLKKRKCIEEDRIEMKKRKIPSLKEDKKQSDPDSHRKIDSSMDNSTTSNKDMELLLDYLDIDLDSFDIDDQTFEVEMNALDNEDKNLEICDKDGNLMNDETQILNKNTNVSAYDTNVSSDLEMFLHEMIYGESEKIIQMKSYLPDV